jgi:phospholipid-binding lipoprotein MlaA
LVAAIGVLASACASGGAQLDSDGSDLTASSEINDPIEGVNRAIFGFNDKVDSVVFKPVAKVYRFVLPEPVRDSIRNFLNNLESPVILANDLLQGQFARGGETTTRFLINSTIGLAGMFDVADNLGIERHEEDFGQTLAVWGVGDGFYLVLPFLGPSSVRDGVGMAVDSAMDPFNYVIGSAAVSNGLSRGRTIVEGVDTRAENIDTLDQIKADSIDFYARIRSMYVQHRQFLIDNGDDPDAISAPEMIILDTNDEFGDDFDDAFGSDFEDDFAPSGDLETDPASEGSPTDQAEDELRREGIEVDIMMKKEGEE